MEVSAETLNGAGSNHLVEEEKKAEGTGDRTQCLFITQSRHPHQQKGKIAIGTEVEHNHNKEREEHPSLDTPRFSKERLLHVMVLVGCIGYVVLKHSEKNTIAGKQW